MRQRIPDADDGIPRVVRFAEGRQRYPGQSTIQRRTSDVRGRLDTRESRARTSAQSALISMITHPGRHGGNVM